MLSLTKLLVTTSTRAVVEVETDRPPLVPPSADTNDDPLAVGAAAAAVAATEGCEAPI